jgi:hypothetical protein
MYLSESEVSILLKHPFYSTHSTENTYKYVMYRDKFNVDVYTLRYNILADFDENVMFNSVLHRVMDRFSGNIVCMTDYDLLLCAQDSDPKSYYLWRANSNQRQKNTNETVMPLTYDNLFLYIKNSANFHIPSLNVEFHSSNVTIERVLSIVFTFLNV